MKKNIIILLVIIGFGFAIYLLLESNNQFRENLTPEQSNHISKIKAQILNAKLKYVIEFNDGKLAVINTLPSESNFNYTTCFGCPENIRSYDEWNLIDIKRVVSTDNPEYPELAAKFLKKIN